MSEYTDKLLVANREQLIGEILRLRGEASRMHTIVAEYVDQCELVHEPPWLDSDSSRDELARRYVALLGLVGKP